MQFCARSYTTFSVSENGTYTVYAKDTAGNTTVETIEITNIDKTPPEEATFSFTPTDATNQEVTVTISYPDLGELRQYRIGSDGSWSEYTEPIMVEENTTIYARSQSSVGTWSEESSVEIKNIDREKPIIMIVGEATITVTQGSSFIDPGATATDNLDSDISSKIVVTGNVDTSQVGEYTLTYQVTDRAGNVADEVTRTVTVTAPPSSGGGGGESYTPPPTTTNSEVNPNSGGVISTGDISITFPPEVFSRTFHVTVDKVQNLKAEWEPIDQALISEIYEITKDQEGDFDQPVTITLPFQHENIDRNQYDIAVYWLNEETEEWVQLDNIKVDWNQGKVSGDVDHFTKFAVLATEKSPIVLTDMQGHWAEEYVIELIDLGAISGYPDGTFKPNNPITRAEFTAIVIRALGLEMSGSKTFRDTTNHWAKDVIATAYEHGIIQGYNETIFGANDPITREQMAAIIVNAFELQQGQGNTFTDNQHISTWAQEAIQKALSNGIITGYEDGTFKPKNNATRAEAVAVIVRALDN